MATQSVWEGIVDEPKTRKSKAPIPVIVPLQRMLDAHKLRCGNPTTGPMFATMDGKKAIRPSNVVNRQILPVLNACECAKTAEDRAEEDHEYKPMLHYRSGMAGMGSGVGWQQSCMTWQSMILPIKEFSDTLMLRSHRLRTSRLWILSGSMPCMNLSVSSKSVLHYLQLRDFDFVQRLCNAGSGKMFVSC
jgi:hypothetical protein